MRIAYVLPFPELNGGNKVVMLHARLLGRLGHEVSILGEGARPDWFPPEVSYVDRRHEFRVPSQDLVLATYWTTVASAERLELGPTSHFCQGFEGDLPHLEAQRGAIDEAYDRRAPLLAVTAALGERLSARFARPFRVVPPTLDTRFTPRWRWAPRRDPWIVVPGIFESSVKDVPTALLAVRWLRERGVGARVRRVSILPLSDAERAIVEPDDYVAGVAPELVAKMFSDSDLLLFPSLPGEGFGLPLLEALASGLPAVASRLPSTEWIGGGAAALVSPGDVEAFGAAALALLEPATWRRARRRGFLAAERFTARRLGASIEEALSWAAQAGRASDPPRGTESLVLSA
jgi:glycosyltransferase involved in cell wall biosynthesis